MVGMKEQETKDLSDELEESTMENLMVEMKKKVTDDLSIDLLDGKMGDKKVVLRDILSSLNMTERKGNFDTGHSVVMKMVLSTVALMEILLVNKMEVQEKPVDKWLGSKLV